MTVYEIKFQFFNLAAHCCQGQDEALLHFGQKNEFDVMSASFSLSSKSFYIHEEYSPVIGNNDVCLIRTKESISTVAMTSCGMTNTCVAQTCLPLTPIRHGLACWISSWDDAGNRISGGVNVFSKRSCKKSGLAPDDITRGEFCTGIVDNDRLQSTACQPESGGPLMCDVKGRITTSATFSRNSFSGCYNSGNIGVFTDLHDFKDWIAVTIGRYN